MAKISERQQLENFLSSPYRREQFWKLWVEKVYVDNGKNPVQMVSTPEFLCSEIVDKLKEHCDISDKKILTLNVEFVPFLLDCGELWFFSDNKEKGRMVSTFYPNVKVVYGNLLGWETDMKFDVIVGNPPYQSKSDKSDTKTQSIWDKFVKLSLNITKIDGYICLVHPSGWRSCGNIFTDAQIIKQKQIEYLEIHGEKDGLKTFKATTRYDWYILKNCPITHVTKIMGQDNILSNIDLRKISFVPNYMIDKIFSLLAKKDEEKVKIEYSRSAYGSDKNNISENKHDSFIYSVIYSTPINKPTIWYSSTKDNGHFGISKIILNPCRPIGFVVDKKGQYGMSQFCVGIVGDSDYLDMVAEVIKNQKTNGFAEFMEACHFTDKIFNKDIICQLRKDFWKEFV